MNHILDIIRNVYHSSDIGVASVKEIICVSKNKPEYEQ